VNAGGDSATPRGLTREDAFALLGGLGSILTLVTAVLFYFGWRRSYEQARAMSIDVSLFGFSPQDYVSRGISSLYLPLLVVFGLVLGCLWLHSHVSPWLRSDVSAARRRRRTAVASILWAAGTVLAVSCVMFLLAAGLRDPPWLIARLADKLRPQQWAVSLVLVIATLTSAYAGWARRQLQRSSDTPALTVWHRVLSTVLITGIVIWGVSWMLEQYAVAVGRGYARQLVQGVDQLPRAVVLSPTPLGLQAPGLDEERLGDAFSATVRYRTKGLRLLARSGGKVLLVHDGWNPDTGTVIVLADSDELAWQFSR
jgi:hypothetical protein